MMSQTVEKVSFYDEAWRAWNDMVNYSPAPRLRRTKVIDILKKRSFKSLLDVGCGNGAFLKEVGDNISDVALAGADISPSVTEANRQRFTGMEFFTIDLDTETPTGKYDVVVAMEMLQYTVHYNIVIQKLADITNQRLIITVPCGPVFEIDRRVGHKRHFTVNEILSAVEKTGLKILWYQKWGFPFFNLYKHAINLSPNKVCESFLSEKPYTWRQKVVAGIAYQAFRLCLPRGGYQLFVEAAR
ncbi:MAG: methyltransferase [Nitrospirae bacterium]|nr:methyltransferase [Nitrospirota bacterium]